ncbi:S-layer homology domain-containing protein [Metasolibacillus meyeri]|uniref:S-layer homology domain-containing protein n=1 Tax=Metasolibacillus meyeri TaxID=1071052 RepID=A0AAW9NTT1_9BACL|nr:S-layer homology domain-containing protein [Metasolibacillus meyeri]MEC1179593.1 S-layer homology domain-containing protein [Metasolibacillus meyeri]
MRRKLLLSTLCFVFFMGMLGLPESSTVNAFVNIERPIMVTQLQKQSVVESNRDARDLQAVKAPVIKIAATDPTFTVSPGSVTFTNLMEGYTLSQRNAIQQDITLTKVGVGAITNFQASLSGAANTKFLIGTVPPDTLGAGVNSTVLKIQPNMFIAPGTYTETLTFTADGDLSESIQVSFTVDPSPTSFTVSPSAVTFANLTEGYTVSQRDVIQQDITLTKVGVGAITNFQASLSGGVETKFLIGTVHPNSLGAGVNSTVLKIRPNMFLSPGTYTETLTFTADGDLSESIQVSFTVDSSPTSFTVSPSAVTFANLTEGYTVGQRDAIHQDITLTKVGVGTITNFQASLSGGADTKFLLGTVLSDALGAGVLSAVLKIRPKMSLEPGTYTEMLTFTADGGLSENIQVSFTVDSSMHAATPVIHTQPLSATVDEGGNITLSVDASISDGGTLSYQWFSNTINNSSDGTLIQGATSASYTIPTDTAGTIYYYVVVKNTNNNVSGVKVATVTSDVAQILIYSLIDAVISAKDALTIGYAPGDNMFNVTQPLQLATTGLHDTTISWVSSHPSIIQNNGMVIRPVSGDSSVTLTATIRKGNVTEVKVFMVIVKGVNNFVSPIFSEEINNVSTPSLTINMNIGNGITISQIVMQRIENADGTLHDTIRLTEQSMIEILAKLRENNANTVYMMLPDIEDTIRQIDVFITNNIVLLLHDNDISLVMETRDVKISVDKDSFSLLEEDLYFRVIPVKSQTEQQIIEERARVEEQVRRLAGTMTVEMLGRPMTIETNLQNRPVTLTLPLPIDIMQHQLEQLMIYIEHSDGTKELINGQIVAFDDNTQGIQFDVSKFSTFAILYVPEEVIVETNEREPYIKGYVDGTFLPDASVTRAQIASMFARYLTNNMLPEAHATFVDAERHGAKDAIEYVRSIGLFDGTTSTTFNPNGLITRAQMAAVVVRWIDAHCMVDADATFCKEISTERVFSDVAANHWAAHAIRKISALGFMSGVDTNTFNPNGSVTRAQAVSILNDLFELELTTNVEGLVFTDVTPAHWAFYEIQTAAGR